MKKISFLLFALVCIAGCSDRFSDGGTGESIAPVALFGNGETNLVNAIDGCDLLVQSILNENGAVQGEDFAMVINDAGQLHERVIGETVYSWPTIDFNSYSLVVGKFCTPEMGYLLANQHIVRTLFQVVLYLNILEESEIHSAAPCEYCFAACYPKLPTNKVVIKRSDR